MTDPFPKTIKVDVSFYDEWEGQKLLKYPSANEIRQIVSNPVEIPSAEFLTYFLFNRKRANPTVYRNYWQMQQYLGVALNEMLGFLDFNAQSISLAPTLDQPRRTISEYVGESIGLSIISRVHGLTEADWIPIPEGIRRTFDYEIASTGNQIVQVEAKGTSIEDNRIQSQNVLSQKNRLDAKKADLRKLVAEGKDPHPASLRYGTIVAIDSRRDGVVKCWLTDPDPDPIKETPERMRLLSRLKFLRDWISFISPRSQFSSSLNTRLGCIEKIKDPNELDNSPLRRLNGELYSFAPMFAFGQEFSFFSNKSRIVNGSAGGVTLQLSPNELLFLGLREDVVMLAAKQNFEAIVTMKFPVTTEDKEVECVFSTNRYKELGPIIPESLPKDKSKQYIKFKLKGQLHFSASGLVFGILPIPQ